MTKSVAAQYHETLKESKGCKPRSGRRGVLVERAKQLMLRQLKIENREKSS